MSDRTCVVCAAQLTGRQTVVCSKPCRTKRLGQSEALKRAVAKHRKTDKYKSSASDYRCRIKPSLYDKPCPGGCGQVIRRDSPRCRRCTKRTPPTRMTVAQRKASRAAAGVLGWGRWLVGPCPRCGLPVTVRVTTAGAIGYCTDRCRQSDKSDRRRARSAGAKLTPGRRHAVFERDGWICQLCGDPTDRTVRAPSPLAPTIDHRIPLAGGGEHAPGNWQTAHSLCNSMKRDTMPTALLA